MPFSAADKQIATEIMIAYISQAQKPSNFFDPGIIEDFKI